MRSTNPTSISTLRLDRSIYEQQAFLVELVKNFEFSMEPALVAKILRQPGIVMLPAVAGEVEKGPQLPITIREIQVL